MTRLIPLLLAVAAIAAAQDSSSPKPDPAGWSNISWGMTIAEIRAALGTQVAIRAKSPAPTQHSSIA